MVITSKNNKKTNSENGLRFINKNRRRTKEKFGQSDFQHERKTRRGKNARKASLLDYRKLWGFANTGPLQVMTCVKYEVKLN